MRRSNYRKSGTCAPQKPRIAPTLLFVAAWLSSPLLAQPATPADEHLAGLQRWLDGTRDLSGEFEQELLSGALGTGIEERGHFALSRPGRLRFDYIEPERKIAIVDGTRTTFWVEEDETLTTGELDENSDLLSALLIGRTPLAELFVPSIDVAPTARGRLRLRLTPRVDEATVTELVLTLRTRGHEIEAVEVLDPAGNRMLYRFPRMRRNSGVDDGLFRFPSAAAAGR